MRLRPIPWVTIDRAPHRRILPLDSTARKLEFGQRQCLRFGWRADGPDTQGRIRQATANQRTESLRKGYVMIPEQEIVTKEKQQVEGIEKSPSRTLLRAGC